MTFDMHRIGQTIARLRRERNMTQMQLADEMGVSFQAVSNWERGQSMPDISKLPELAELFAITIDELLGCRAPLVEQAAAGQLEAFLDQLDAQGTPVDAAEVIDAAPLLPPAQVEQLTDRLTDLAALPNLAELLPHLSTARVDALLLQAVNGGSSYHDYAPFASSKALIQTARLLESQGKSCQAIAPFLPQAAVDEIAATRAAAEQSFHDLLPFMSPRTLIDFARQLEAQRESCRAFAPFLPRAAIIDIAADRLRDGRSIRELLPFLDEPTLDGLAVQIIRQHGK